MTYQGYDVCCTDDELSGRVPLDRHYQDAVAITTAAAADPELNIESEMPTLESIITSDVLRSLKKKERKRQDVINGIAETYLTTFFQDNLDEPAPERQNHSGF